MQQNISSNTMRQHIPPFFINRESTAYTMRGYKKGQFIVFSFTLYKRPFGDIFGRRFTVVSFHVPVIFPNILLDGHKNRRPPFTYENFDRIELEANFHRYFSLYCESGSHIDALSIITPELMQVLVQEGTRYDIAIWQNKVAIIAKGNHMKPRKLNDMIRAADAVQGDFMHRSKSWNSLPKKTTIFHDKKLVY